VRCSQARQLVSDYLDGDLDGTTARALEDHLAGCPSCPPLAAALQGVLAQLRSLPEPPTDPAQLFAILALLRSDDLLRSDHHPTGDLP
jgi:anti-sigma factor RsiW